MKSYLRSLLDLGRARVAAAILLALGVAGLEGAGLLMLAPLLAASGAGGVVPGRMACLPGGLPAILALWVVVVALHAGASALRDSLIFRLQQDLADQRRIALISAAAAMEWRAFAAERGSDLTAQLTASAARLQSGTGALLQAVARALLLLAHAAVAMIVQPAAGALALLAGIGLAALRGGALRRSAAQGRGLEADARLLQGVAEEQVASMKLIKAWAMGAQAAAAISGAVTRQAAERSRERGMHLTERARMRILSALCAAAGVGAAVEWLGLSGAPLLVLAAVFARLLPAAGEVVRLTALAAESLPAWTEGEVMLQRFRAAAEPEEDEGAVFPAGDIVLSDVSFAWTGREGVALDGVSVTLVQGVITALIGPSGAGKSTLADIAVGLLPPARGEVSVGGVPLRGAARAAWRRRCAYVLQDTILFHASVRDNLLWGRPDAPEKLLWDSLRAAHAEELVRRLPQGLDTALGDRGLGLSGGERQRLALARALVREPLFLVLDEATSAVDSDAEDRIMAALQGLRGKLTMLVIAHRLSTVRDADRVLRVQDGRIAVSQ